MRARDDRVGLNVWSPTVNLLRHPLWGRNEEGYSEDPELTSAIATAYTRGLRGDHPAYWRTAPVLKHWLAHNNETDRDTTSSSVRPRVLHEYDLRAFRETVEAGAVAGVMPAYNLVNGRPNHVSPYLREHLRAWTDQELLVCSDAGAPSNLVDSEHYFDTHEEATAAALLAGVDSFTDHGKDGSRIAARVRGALERGLLTEADIDTAVRRQLAVRFRLGEFDPDLDPYARHRRLRHARPPRARPGGRGAGDRPARRTTVLLPLRPGTRVAVVGLLADECKLDWYSGTLIHRSTPLEGLYERFGAERVELRRGRGPRPAEDVVRRYLAVPAARRRVRRGARRRGRPRPGAARRPHRPAPADRRRRRHRTGAGRLGRGRPHPARARRPLPLGRRGRLRPRLRRPAGRLGRPGDLPAGTLASIDERPPPQAPGDGQVRLCRRRRREGCRREPGNPEIFELEFAERGEDAVARAAAAADVVLVVAGNDPHINGRETEDRTTLRLPAQQERLLRAARAANPDTVLALVSAYPYAVDACRPARRCCGPRTAARRRAPPWPASSPGRLPRGPPPADLVRRRRRPARPSRLRRDRRPADLPLLRGHSRCSRSDTACRTPRSPTPI